MAQALVGECNDKLERLRTTQRILENRIECIKESAGELVWLLRNLNMVQSHKATTQILEDNRDHFRECAANPEGLVLPPRMFAQVADLCETILAEKAAFYDKVEKVAACQK